MNPQTILAQGDELVKFIPQRAPFVMVDRLYRCEENFVHTGFQPTDKNIFSENGFFTEPGLIENMAQSAAAGTGYFFISKGLDVPVGFIGAIKDFKLFRLSNVNDLLETEITVVAKVMNATVIKANIRSNGEEIAFCEMKIFLLDTSRPVAS
ncbi:MAG: hydroxymyristoyl-ACP dehydratase [Bacteroidota bacterium]